MDEARAFSFLRPIARAHAAGLVVAAVRAARNLAIAVLAGQPDFDIEGLARGGAHVAAAQNDGAERQAEPLQHLLGASSHALMLGVRLLRRGDADPLDLGELVLADHAAGVLAGRAPLWANTPPSGRGAP